MKIAITSDLHINYHDWPIDWPEADVLLIAGDTANDMQTSNRLWKEAAGHYRDVLVIDGNHDHWSRPEREMTVEENIQSILPHLDSNVHFLGHHNPSMIINGIKFIGVNGWYSADYGGDPEMARHSYSDYSDYQRIFQGTHQTMPWYRAQDDAEMINSELASGHPSVVMTHTIPHRSCVKDGPQFAASNNFFYNSHMEKIIEGECDNLRMWVFGHTHDRMEKTINDVLVHANPRGQRSENPRWWVTTYDV